MKVQGSITIDGIVLYDVIGYMRRDDEDSPRIELNNSNGSLIAMLYVEDIEYCEVNEQNEDGNYTGETTLIIDDGEIICDKLL